MESIEKKKTGMIDFLSFIFLIALNIPNVFARSISAPLVSPKPGVSQNRNFNLL
jgi:hypothetical protein